MTTHMAAVDLDDPAGTSDPGAFHFRCHGFADLVGQDEGRLVLDVQVPRQRQRALTFDLIDENRDRGEIGADRQLAESEQGAGGQREIGPARLGKRQRAAPAGLRQS
jgi:hypothetical protein